MQVGYIKPIGLCLLHIVKLKHIAQWCSSAQHICFCPASYCREYAGMFGEMLPRYTRGLCIDFSGDVQANVAPPYRELLWM